MSLRIVLTISIVVAGRVGSDYLQPTNQIGQKTLNLSTLKFVSVVARHGSRSPLSTYPNDNYAYNDSRYWPDGVGSLTRAGKIQCYSLGQQLRSRYGGFINLYYFDNETIFQSNANDRDLNSAQLMAAGLYPPGGFQIWNSSLLWQPIAVWSTEYQTSDTENNCPKFREERTPLLSELYQEIYAQNVDFFAQIANDTGLLVSQLWWKLSSLYEDIILLRENGYPKPAWANADVMNKLFLIVSRQYQIEVAGTKIIKQLMTGPILESLIEQFNNKTEGTLDPDRKMYILAGHDTTIMALVGGLGIDELLLPDPGSYLIFEIHTSDQKDIIQVLYFNHSATTTPTLFEIPDCHHPCPLINFTQLALQIVANSSRENCVIDSGTSATFLPAESFLFVLISVLISVV